MVSDEDFDASESSEEEVQPDRDEDDSDFVADDVDDSGSDWGASQISKKTKVSDGCFS